jgi:hypothetical protein
MRKTISRIALSIGCLMTMAAIASADTKITSRQTSGGQTYENKSYIKGKRQRTETSNGQMVIVQQCDLRRNIQIMPQAQAYMIQPYDQPATSTAPNTPATTSQPGAVKKGGVVTSTVTTRDTGERKQMLGYPARHIITTMVMDSTPDACSPVKNKMEIDGWYIDAAFALDCDSSQAYMASRPQAGGGCRDRHETRQIGAARKGYPVWEKTTMFGPNGAESFSTLTEVVEISQATLDASLFDIPEGYREVQDFASAFSAAGYGAAQPGNAPSNEPAPSANVMSAASQPSAPTEVGPKKQGVIRVGLFAVKTSNVAENMSAKDLAQAVQNTLTQSLKTRNIEVVAIEAQYSPAAETEAQKKECDYVVYVNVSHKKGGGGGFGSVFGSAASVVGSGVGYGGSTAAATAASVATNVIVAEKIKPKDELTLDVRLQAPTANTPALIKQFKGKAKSGGEDIITPVTEQAAQAIVDATKH